MSAPQVNRADPQACLRVLDATLDTARASGASTGLLLVHLENFDRLVSAFGYRLGNRIIAAFAERLRKSVRPQDDLVRLSDSKFVIVIRALRNDAIMTLAGNKILEAFAKPIATGETDVAVELRIGMAAAPVDGDDAERLLQHAETALLAAIAESRPCVRYAQAHAEANLDSLQLELELDAAIKRKEFQLHYQPKIAADDFRPCGAEALIRWTSPRRGPVSPELFIPIADREGRIEPLTAFVLNTALRQAVDWPGHWGKLSVSVNVTPRLLLDSDLVDMVAGALKLWDFEPGCLMLEVTEGAVMTDPARSFGILTSLRELGVKISIDDFGTGYSSLTHFKNIPADELKIDKSFVLNMLEDDGDRQIVKTVIELSKGFGLQVTAEGVEDERTATMLADMRCDRLQGYFYSKPLPQQEFVTWLQAYERRTAVAV